MNTTADWLEGNRRQLLTELARVRAALERHVGEAGGGGAAPRDAASSGPFDHAAAEVDASFALELLAQRFGLSPFERDVLLLAAGPELDARFHGLLAATSEGAAHPTFSLALAALTGAHWSACTPAGPLRRWRLVELGAGDTLMTSPLHIDERVLHYLVGTPHPDERLRGALEPLAPGEPVPAARSTLAAELAERWWRPADGGRGDVLVLHGGERGLRRLLATAVAAIIGIQLLRTRAESIPSAPDERVDWFRLLERECVLSDAAALIEEGEGAADGAAERALTHAIETLGVPLIVSGEHPPVVPGRGMIVAEVAPLSYPELREAWTAALGEDGALLNGTLERVAGQFRMGLDAIAAVGAAVRRGPPQAEGQLWGLCRAFARPRLDGLARRIGAAATWADLVLPAQQLDVLRAIALHVRHRVTVHQHWGFADSSGRGQGITALFSGPSGTGKTMAAEVLANELQLDLYRIDLSQVVSKYIGETEKNLRRVFDAAEGGAAILLFDEADALFGKRSDVKDSHDRYANIEVGYLLQRMEAYQGLAILTTNHAAAIDSAFLRRLRFGVTFPFPDTGARAEIWRRAFPAAAPTDGIDPARLARLSVAGGNIRSIALHAAFFAAAAGEPVRMPHLLRAARLEYAKLERPLTDSEIGGWT